MEKEKKELKIKEGKKISVFTFAPPLFFHLIQLPATITTPTLHGKVAERVRGGCSRDTVYIFAHNPSQSSKGMVRRLYYSSPKTTPLQLYYTRRTFRRQRHGCHVWTASRLQEAHVRTDQNTQLQLLMVLLGTVPPGSFLFKNQFRNWFKNDQEKKEFRIDFYIRKSSNWVLIRF